MLSGGLPNKFTVFELLGCISEDVCRYVLAMQKVGLKEYEPTQEIIAYVF